MTSRLPTLLALANDLASGRTTATRLVEDCLERIRDDNGEGSRTFIHVDVEGALAAAAKMDTLRNAGTHPSPYAGIPISTKDLFDIEGQVTRAGSRVLDKTAPAGRDAPPVSRLRQAGFISIGRTNMTEFAFSGLGMNPHYGTPLNPWDRATGRIPGGSSSGAAISVSDGMAHAALGTDTGGSCRIPAAFTGLVGFKPTACRVPLEGCLPLSPSLDSVGSIARSVQCCATIDAIISNEPHPTGETISLNGLRFAAPTNLVLNDIDPDVELLFLAALDRLRGCGVSIDNMAIPALDRIAGMNSKGGFAAPESYAYHYDLLMSRSRDYDPRVEVRIRRGSEQSALDYLRLQMQRKTLIEDVERATQGYDAIVMPTVPILPPTLASLRDDGEYGRVNLLALRNSTIINLIDGCAISIPISRRDEAPVGLMLAARHGCDRTLLALAGAVENALSQA